MKKIITIITLATFLFGCEDLLDKTPLDDISSSSFWNTEEDLKLAVNNLYTGIGRSATLDIQSLDYYGKGPNNVSSGTNVISNSNENWSGSYTQIRRANDILENVEHAQVAQEVEDRYAAEARFFRAYQYFRLIKHFGDVPLVLNTLDFSSEALYDTRTKRTTVLDQIVNDLLWAADHLPKKSELSSNNQGRITRGTALGFLSRVTLYEGTRAKYHGDGSPDDLLQIAKDAAMEVINSEEYALFPDFVGIFSQANEDNAEVMLSVRYEENITGTSPRGRGMVLDAEQAPTKYLADAFLSIDGLPIEHSTLFQGYSTLESEFVDRDPRMEGTIWRPGTEFENGALLIPDLTRTFTGYWPKKPGDPLALEVTFIYTDDILMRYAEILLNYAEAVYELNGSISDEDLNISINKLRDRVGMPHLTNDFVNGNNPANVMLDMREEIRRERRVELAGESMRYDDLIRWKTAETELPQPVLGIMFQADQYPTIVPGQDIRLDENGFIIAQQGDSRTFNAPKNYLFPVPLREISLNPDLGQNPGWN